MNAYFRFAWLAAATAAIVVLSGCAPRGDAAAGAGDGKARQGAPIAMSIDGSSTVFPLVSAVAEEYKLGRNPNAQITIGQSGTGGGFKKFGNREIDIALASRPITEDEARRALANGVEFIELPIAFDGLTVAVNIQNDWAKHLTVEELRRIWEPNSRINNWKDVRPGFPDVPLKLYGAGTDSGTFDYFTKAIVGREKASRTDYMGSEDDNMLVTGVKGDKGALGYFGFSFYLANRDSIRAVAIDAGKGPVAPSFETVANATYVPLSRPLLLYVSKPALEANPGIADFLRFLLQDSEAVIKETGFVPLPKDAVELVVRHLEEKRTGTLFRGAEIDITVAEIMRRERAAR
jgi:phosphate transport system substrate-binding protein